MRILFHEDESTGSSQKPHFSVPALSIILPNDTDMVEGLITWPVKDHKVIVFR